MPMSPFVRTFSPITAAIPQQEISDGFSHDLTEGLVPTGNEVGSSIRVYRQTPRVLFLKSGLSGIALLRVKQNDAERQDRLRAVGLLKVAIELIHINLKEMVGGNETVRRHDVGKQAAAGQISANRNGQGLVGRNQEPGIGVRFIRIRSNPVNERPAREQRRNRAGTEGEHAAAPVGRRFGDGGSLQRKTLPLDSRPGQAAGEQQAQRDGQREAMAEKCLFHNYDRFKV